MFKTLKFLYVKLGGEGPQLFWNASTLLASFLMWYRRLACSYFFLLEEQARRLYHTLLIKNA
jgi:hypothetical protein